MAAGFMFATGIENSYPTIRNGAKRVDEMESCGHYQHWRRDFDCVEELGIRFLRYGPPLPRPECGPGVQRPASSVCGESYPVLWLSVVGRNELWPVRAIAVDTERDARDFLFTLYVCRGGGGGCVIGSSSWRWSGVVG